MRGNIVAILLIYGAIVIFLLFWDHRDTKSESCEIFISMYQPISTQEKKEKAVCENDIYTIKDGRKYCGNSSYLCI